VKLLLFPCSTPSVPIYIICIYNIMVIICWMYLKSSFNSVHHQFLYYYITFVYYYYYYNMVCLLCEHTCCDDCASPHARTTYVVYFFKIERSNTVWMNIPQNTVLNIPIRPSWLRGWRYVNTIVLTFLNIKQNT